MIETSSIYLRIVGPFYGFYCGGVALFFASQGFGRLFWPTNAGVHATGICPWRERMKP